MDDYLNKLFGGLVSLGVLLFGWLIRVVFTNNKKITILEQELKHHNDKVNIRLDAVEDQSKKSLHVQEEILSTLRHIDERKKL